MSKNITPGKREITPEESKIFLQRMENFSPEAQEFIADLSSHLVEPDVHLKYSRNPKTLQQVRETLQAQGLSPEDIDGVLDYFNLPQQTRENNF